MRSKNTFSVNSDKSEAGITLFFDKLLTADLNEGVTGVEKLPGGVNSEAFKISTDKHNEYFAKRYYRWKGDDRDRLSTEFSALSFLWANGVRNIPEPIKAFEKSGVAIYRYIRGAKIRPGKVTPAHVNEAADFAGRLHALSGSKDAEVQPAASEACFSVKAYMDCVEGRVKNLQKAAVAHEPLQEYLKNEFIPFLDTVKKMTVQKCEEYGIDINEEIQAKERTLSASDFGFHNALKTEDGRLYFIDFEYYGWDDPAKMISDFYLQPAVQIPLDCRKCFFEKVRKNYSESGLLEKRLSAIYPILGLKWCLIMLNVFLRSSDGQGDKALCSKQLAKASEKLKEVKNEIKMKAFPISYE